MTSTAVRVDPAVALAHLHAALDELAAADLSTGNDDDHLQLLRELERARRRVPSIDHALIMELEARGIAAAVGAKTTGRLLVGLLRIESSEAYARVRAAEAAGARRTLTGEKLEPAYPVLAAGQAAGVVSERQARIIVDTVEKLPDAVRVEHATQVESDLVGYAERFGPGPLSKLALRMSAWLDPDGTFHDVELRAKNRTVTLATRTDGSASLAGEVTAELSELLQVLFDAHAAPKPEKDGVKDQRSAGQRRHDALLDGLKTLVRSEVLPKAGGVAATIVVTMSEQAYRTGTGLAQTGHGAIVPASEALRWGGGDIQLLAVAIGSMKHITAYGTTHRLFTPTQRLAIHARDGGCTFPNCPAPPGWCEIHHLIDYANRGPTSIDNGAMLCGADHRERIKEGWTATLINGRVGWIPPRWIDPDQKPRYNDLHRPGA